jgi:hypothetical protein
MNLNSILILLILFPLPQQTFTRFTYCREMARGLYERQCVSVTPDGTGQSQLKRRGADQIDSQVNLSLAGREKLGSRQQTI